jgi:hypothetical protein
LFGGVAGAGAGGFGVDGDRLAPPRGIRQCTSVSSLRSTLSAARSVVGMS